LGEAGFEIGGASFLRFQALGACGNFGGSGETGEQPADEHAHDGCAEFGQVWREWGRKPFSGKDFRTGEGVFW
jgi:hypothetical protein